MHLLQCLCTYFPRSNGHRISIRIKKSFECLHLTLFHFLFVRCTSSQGNKCYYYNAQQSFNPRYFPHSTRIKQFIRTNILFFGDIQQYFYQILQKSCRIYNLNSSLTGVYVHFYLHAYTHALHRPVYRHLAMVQAKRNRVQANLPTLHISFCLPLAFTGSETVFIGITAYVYQINTTCLFHLQSIFSIYHIRKSPASQL